MLDSWLVSEKCYTNCRTCPPAVVTSKVSQYVPDAVWRCLENLNSFKLTFASTNDLNCLHSTTKHNFSCQPIAVAFPWWLRAPAVQLTFAVEPQQPKWTALTQWTMTPLCPSWSMIATFLKQPTIPVYLPWPFKLTSFHKHDTFSHLANHCVNVGLLILEKKCTAAAPLQLWRQKCFRRGCFRHCLVIRWAVCLKHSDTFKLTSPSTDD